MLFKSISFFILIVLYLFCEILFRPPQFPPALQMRLPFSPNLQPRPGLAVPHQLPSNPGNTFTLQIVVTLLYHIFTEVN